MGWVPGGLGRRPVAALAQWSPFEQKQHEFADRSVDHHANTMRSPLPAEDGADGSDALARRVACALPVDVAGDRDRRVPEDLGATLSGTPWLSITLAAECRSVCSPMSGRPARAAATLSARKAFRGSQGSPNSVVNTNPVWCHADPARERSSA